MQRCGCATIALFVSAQRDCFLLSLQEQLQRFCAYALYSQSVTFQTNSYWQWKTSRHDVLVCLCQAWLFLPVFVGTAAEAIELRSLVKILGDAPRGLQIREHLLILMQRCGCATIALFFSAQRDGVVPRRLLEWMLGGKKGSHSLFSTHKQMV